MANTLQVKRSAVASKVPTTAQLALGEFALNTYDGHLFYKKNNGTESIVVLKPITKANIEAELTGSITSHSHANITGNAATATKLATARSIALSGDVSGSASFDGSSNISITATVADDSHNHIIGNVDGLQTALDGKASTSVATTSANGLMSSTDKTKLNGIRENAGYQDKIHSQRQFSNGTLIQTSIDYSVSSGDPWILEITGNSYSTSSSRLPFDIQVQGYIYNDGVINIGGISVGTGITDMVLFNYNGNLCFWFPYQSYWQGFNVRCYIANSNTPYQPNKVTSITNEAKPSGVTKEHSVAIYQVWSEANDGAGSGLDADLLDGYHASASPTGDTIALRSSGGNLDCYYLNSQYCNMSHSASTRNSDTVFYSSTDNYIRKNNATGFKTSLALNNVDNTSDDDKPISTATQTALNAKLNTAGGTLSGPLYISASSGTRVLSLRNGEGSTSFTNTTQLAFGYNNTDNYKHFIHTRHNSSGATGNAIDFYICNGTSANDLVSGTVHALSMNGGYVGINGVTNPSYALDVTGYIRCTEKVICTTANITAGSGRGISFWGSDAYKIFMGQVSDGTWGGRITGDTTSDYNIYFRIGSGTNRGFVFESDNSTKLFAINPDGVRSNQAIYCPTPSANDNSTKVATTAYVDNAVSGSSGGITTGKAIAMAMIFG